MRDPIKRRNYIREWMRGWRAKNPEKNLARQRKDSAKKRELHRDEINELQRIRYRENPEKPRKLSRVWRLTHPEKRRRMWYSWYLRNREKAAECGQRYRARKRNATISDCTNKIAELRKSSLCFWCKQPMGSLTIDHVIPLSRGGKHSPDNLVAACKKCNCSKYDKLVSEWQPIQAVKDIMKTEKQSTQVP